MERAQPLVSVVIPTYDRAALLRKALESVFAQTWTQYEVIVVDDGSTDSTREIIGQWSDRLTYIWQENRGVAEARNRGTSAARGEWIAFLDSDDLWLPEKLARCMERVRRAPDTAILFHPMTEIDDAGNRVRGRSKRAAAGRIVDRLFAHCFVHTPTVVVRRDVLKQAGGFSAELEVCEDYQLWLRIALKHPFVMVPEPLALRRLHLCRLSKSAMHRHTILRAEMLQQFYDDLGGRDALDAGMAARRLARVFCSAGKANLQACRYADAHQMLRRSWAYRPFRVKTAALLAYAAMRRNSATDRSSIVLNTAKELSA